MAPRNRPIRVFGSFECSGYCEFDTITGLIGKSSPRGTYEPDFVTLYPKLRHDILSNPSAYKAVEAFVSEQNRTNKIRQQTNANPSFPFISTLNQEEVKALFTAYFASVERYTKAVARPNSVRLIRACGRFNGTVEAVWPICN